MTEQRKGDWMQTASGRRFYPLDPRPEDVDIGDIAHALSMICRFGGHPRTFYSVAEHSVRVSDFCEAHRTEPWHALAGLLHDAAEAYIGDMIRPLKLQPEMVAYKEAERRIEVAIATRFCLPLGAFADGIVKLADNVVLATEARDLMGGEDQWRCLRGHEPLPGCITPWSPTDARAMFMTRFAELTEAR